jgi:hypothetical protein
MLTPSGPWPPSEDTSILLCHLLMSYLLIFLWSVICLSGHVLPSCSWFSTSLVLKKFPIMYLFCNPFIFQSYLCIICLTVKIFNSMVKYTLQPLQVKFPSIHFLCPMMFNTPPPPNQSNQSLYQSILLSPSISLFLYVYLPTYLYASISIYL